MKKLENKTYEKTVVIPITLSMWKLLKKISYEKNISMNKIIRQAIEKHINKFEKIVD